MSIFESSAIAFGPALQVAGFGTVFTDATSMVLDASTEKLGIIYYPSTTSPITDIDVRLNITGAPGNFSIGVFADSSRAPNDAAQLGGYTASFAAPGADGWTGLRALTSNTGNLTINQPVWIVIEYVSGTLDASNNIQLQASLIVRNRPYLRHFNGTNWTTTTPFSTGSPYIAIKHANNSYYGTSATGTVTSSGLPDIFVSSGTVQTQGIRFRSGSMVKVVGVAYQLIKAGSPNDITFTVYEGDTVKYSQTEAAANVITAVNSICWFESPVFLAADTDLHILITQTGTSDSNDYDVNCLTADATYLENWLPATVRFLSGNGTVPSALTASTTKVPLLFPLISDMSVDLDQASVGSSSYPFVG